VASRRDVTAAVTVRYQSNAGSEKESILDEFIQVTGFNRKHANFGKRNGNWLHSK
jgi:hypothetical protein